jgi:hypothetical protein
MRLSIIMGVEAAALAHPPVTQDSAETVHNSRCCNQQSDPESNCGPVQIHKAPPEALAIFMGQQDTMTNNREKYLLQDQTTKVATEALDFFSNQPVTMWNYYVQYKNTIKRYRRRLCPIISQ